MRWWLAAAMIAGLPVRAATLQDQYNAAQTAFDAGRMAEARAGFTAVLPRLDGNPKMAATAAVVRARLGAATLAAGEAEQAVPILVRAVAALPAKGDERRTALLDLARANEVALDFAAAATAYRTLLDNTPAGDVEQLTSSAGLARTLMFSDPAAARGFADTALTLATGLAGGKPNDSVAQLQAIRGRIELNDGKPGDALAWFQKALASAGGLGQRVNVADIRVRGDLALAAYQSGDREGARRYLYYTGAGGLPSEGFELGADMPLPGCAPAGPLARDDMGIVEFAIDDDGRVSHVAPIYASRRGGPELAFARAVRGWSWRPAAAKALPVFWRQSVRMELRCINRGPEDSRWGPGTAVEAWLAEHAPEPLPPVRSEADALPVLEEELARRVSVFGADSPQLLPVTIAIYRNGIRTAEQSLAAVDKGLTVATTNAAPLDLLTYFRSGHLLAVEALAEKRRGLRWLADSHFVDAQKTLLATLDKEGHGQTRGAALILSYIALQAVYDQHRTVAVDAYRRVLAIPASAMPDGDPLRQVARLQLASFEAAASRVGEAQTLLAQTGLTPDQCSAFPVPPILKSAGTTSDFPEEALKWGFEGTVRVAFDLDTQGRPVDVRTVIASPPLVFDEGTEKIGRGLRYQAIFRDGAAIGCVDQQKGVRFRIQSR